MNALAPLESLFDIAADRRTEEAMLRALPLLAEVDVRTLQGRRLDADDFDKLSVDDPVRDLLLWLNNPDTFEVNNDFTYAAKLLTCLADEFDFKSHWSFCARYLPGFPIAGLPLRTVRSLYKSADAILNICGTQEFNDDLLASDRIVYVESDPGVEQIKVDKRRRSTIDYLKRHCALFTFGENVGTERFPVPLHVTTPSHCPP